MATVELFDAGDDGYRVIQIRGVPMTVYCKMDGSPAGTFLDAIAMSFWEAGAQHVTPNEDVTTTFNKLSLNITRCFIFIPRNDSTFSHTQSDPGEGAWLVYVMSQR